jgi:hypothetical protein
LEVQVLSPASSSFRRCARGDLRGMSLALVFGLTFSSLAAAALTIAYALAHR